VWRLGGRTDQMVTKMWKMPHLVNAQISVIACVLLGGLAACDSRGPNPAETAAPDSAPPRQSEEKSALQPHRIYATNEMSGDMTVVDGQTHRVLATVALGKRPRGIQLSPDGTQLFVALSGTPIAGPDVDRESLPPADPSADGIGVFDLATQTLTRVIRGVSDPEQLVVSPDGRRLYVASEDTGTAVVIDIDSGKTLASLPVGGEPEGMGISPDGRFVYVTSEEDHQVSVIDTARDKVLTQFEVGQRPRQAAFSPDGTRAYVTGEMDGTLAVVDTGSHTVIRTIHLTGEMVRPMEVDVSPDGRLAYVTTGRGRTLLAIDTTTYEPVRSVTVGERPWGLAISPDGKRLYTANGPSNDISIVDAHSFTVIATVPAGTRPWGIVTVPSHQGT
jgi:PQQ-dependent catabolism-associated beta-propeller protein